MEPQTLTISLFFPQSQSKINYTLCPPLSHTPDIPTSHTDPLHLQTRKTIRPSASRPTLTPGTVLILLAGRFRGKRVILLRNLPQGVLLVTGPFKINGVPLRRVNARYVIATRAKVPLDGKIDEKVVEKIVGKDGGDGGKAYFTKGKREQREKGEEAFFKQGEKPVKKEVSGERAENQKKVDKAVLEGVRGVPHLREYLASTFSLRKGDKPHAMVF